MRLSSDKWNEGRVYAISSSLALFAIWLAECSGSTMEALEDGSPMKWQKLDAGIIRQRLSPNTWSNCKVSRKYIRPLNFVVRVCMHAQPLTHVQLFTAPWTVACQAPLSYYSSSSLYSKTTGCKVGHNCFQDFCCCCYLNKRYHYS